MGLVTLTFKVTDLYYKEMKRLVKEGKYRSMGELVRLAVRNLIIQENSMKFPTEEMEEFEIDLDQLDEYGE